MLSRSNRLGETGHMRQWFGKVPADPDVLRAAEGAESQPLLLYCLENGTEKGEWVDVVAGLRSKL